MKRLIVPIVLALVLALAGVAVANVLVYNNNFGKQKDVRQIKKLQGGGKCNGNWRGKQKALGVRVSAGNHNCLFRTPVEGDRNQPDYTIQALGKGQRNTHPRVRNRFYIGLAARVSRRSGYEMRVFPKPRKFQLLKNGEEVAGGEHRAIKPLNRDNVLRLKVQGGIVLAKVNGKRLARFKDQSPEEVDGRRTALTFGSEARPDKDGIGVFDKVKVLVPSP